MSVKNTIPSGHLHWCKVWGSFVWKVPSPDYNEEMYAIVYNGYNLGNHNRLPRIRLAPEINADWLDVYAVPLLLEWL